MWRRTLGLGLVLALLLMGMLAAGPAAAQVDDDEDEQLTHLVVELEADEAHVMPGDTVTYTLTVRNTSAYPTGHVFAVQSIPNGFTLVMDESTEGCHEVEVIPFHRFVGCAVPNVEAESEHTFTVVMEAGGPMRMAVSYALGMAADGAVDWDAAGVGVHSMGGPPSTTE